jgi:hypothetical protein
MINSYKNKKKFSSFFIIIYVLFLFIFSLHHHRYDLNERLEFNDPGKENDALVLDFLSDGLSICAINHFSHSILNFSSTSKELRIFISTVKLNFHKTDSVNYAIDLLKNLPTRASPYIS